MCVTLRRRVYTMLTIRITRCSARRDGAWNAADTV